MNIIITDIIKVIAKARRVSSVDTSANSSTYKSGYNAGYAEGLKAGESKVTSTSGSTTTQTASTSSATTGSASTSGGSTSSGRTTTTSTASTSSNKPKSTSASEDDVEMEGSTIQINASTPVGATQTTELGTVTQRTLPTTSTVDSTQKAVVTLHNLPAENTFVLTTNAASATEQATSQQKNNAYKIVDYYKNNLKELGALGSDEIANAATNDNIEVTFDILTSVDIEASEEQKAAIANGDEIELKMTSSDFEDDALYLVIHESDVRTGEFDVMLAKLDNDELTMSLQDLSPVTITKVSVNKVQGIEEAVDETSETDIPDEITEDTNNKPYAWVAYLLIIVAVAFLAVLFVGIKKKGGFSRKK